MDSDADAYLRETYGDYVWMRADGHIHGLAAVIENAFEDDAGMGTSVSVTNCGKRFEGAAYSNDWVPYKGDYEAACQAAAEHGLKWCPCAL